MGVNHAETKRVGELSPFGLVVQRLNPTNPETGKPYSRQALSHEMRSSYPHLSALIQGLPCRGVPPTSEEYIDRLIAALRRLGATVTDEDKHELMKAGIRPGKGYIVVPEGSPHYSLTTEEIELIMEFRQLDESRRFDVLTYARFLLSRGVEGMAHNKDH